MTYKELNELRLQLLLSKAKIAKALGVSRAAIYAWEKSGKVPDVVAMACSALLHNLKPYQDTKK